MKTPPGIASFVPALRRSIVPLVLVLWGFTPSTLSAQRDAPVWDCFLTRFSVYREKGDAIVTDFALRKNGGPYEHTEHQCYLLAVLKSEEAAVQKLAADVAVTNKKAEKSFLQVLQEKKLAVVLETSVSKINSPGGKTPMFPDNTGWPQVAGAQNVDAFAFLYKYTLTTEDLFTSVSKLSGFRTGGAKKNENEVYYEDVFKLFVYVPVNDSKDSTKVAANVRGAPDFAHPMNSITSVLYFRALPYEFEFNRYKDAPIKLMIN